MSVLREKIEELLRLPVDERRRVLRVLQESLPEKGEDTEQSANGDQVSPAAKVAAFNGWSLLTRAE